MAFHIVTENPKLYFYPVIQN